MASELKLVLGNPLFALLFKVFLWLIGVIWLYKEGLGILNLALVFLLFWWIYWGTKFGNYDFKFSFLVILALSILGVLFLSRGVFAVEVILLGSAFFFLGGINDLLFLNKSFFYRLAQFSLFFLIYIFLFSNNEPNLFWIKYLALFFVTFILFYEFFGFWGNSRGWVFKTLGALVVSLVLEELVWVLVILPFNNFSAAGFSVFINFLINDYIVWNLEKKKDIKIHLGFSLAALVIVGAAVMAGTKWGV